MNISAKQFAQRGALDDVVAALRNRARPARLTLEITESMLLDSQATITGWRS